ncbi:sporulation delaying protein family toxin [Streptomyces sp. TRM 70361]|uniref:sporulation delaying protein family toxin n=1 Tax=Streptomyces sp. TRM 70361 TaxID=3116553 RepID=UPI002E7B96E7|nr:sporulation delaying protein family toxin [Streptomyces sp. TRM 70361]MEE1942654.1 sporulation delaying protein family toxin [Streptomyces sp. TRM 70361]
MATPAAPGAPAVGVPAAGVGTLQDGRALFEGLAFAQGRVAEEIADSGEFVDVAAIREENSTPEQRKAVTALLDEIHRMHPGFFASFSGKVRSGSPRLVESGVNEAVEVLKSLAGSESATKADLGTNSGHCINLVLTVNVVVAVNLAAAVNVATAATAANAAAVANVIEFWVAPPRNGEPLSRDQQIAKLTSVLAA